MNPVDTLQDFIVETLHWNGNKDVLTLDYHLIENGVVDSLGLFTLVGFLEDQFGVVIADEELLPENFSTIGAMVKFIERKQPAAQTG